jgi:hypothetical protein
MFLKKFLVVIDTQVYAFKVHLRKNFRGRGEK